MPPDIKNKHDSRVRTIIKTEEKSEFISRVESQFTMTESEATVNDEIDDDQLIKLCLKKPKKWNWELTTSKSSSNIAFPTIQLYDEKGKTMLAEATEAGFIASSKLKKSKSVSKASSLRSARIRDSFRIKFKDSIEEIVHEPIITEPDDDKMSNTKKDESIYSDSNSKEFKRSNEKIRTKPYSRSSSNSMRSRSSVSILERISELKRGSSDEEEEEEIEGKADANDKPNHKYSYRTCTLGTIIVPKESFSNVRRRPRRGDDAAGESTDY